MFKKILSAKPYIIAEIGANHNGNFKKALLLIKNAKKAGCNAVKFQSWDENLNCSSYYKNNKKEYSEYVKYKLNYNQLKKLRKYAKQIKIDFGTSPFSVKQYSEAVKLKCDFIKIASMDLNNYHFLNQVSKCKISLIVSTGFANEDEIIKASKIIKKNKKKNVIFLHCVSLYPPKNENLINLDNMNKIKKLTGYEVGFSDHTIWTETPLAAAALGAKVIEKHFTFNKKAIGWDHSVSADLKEMKNLVKLAKRFYKLKGSLDRKLTSDEIKKSKIMRRSIIITRTKEKNSILKKEDLDLQRPGSGIEPVFLKNYINKRVKKKIIAGSILKKTDVY